MVACVSSLSTLCTSNPVISGSQDKISTDHIITSSFCLLDMQQAWSSLIQHADVDISDKGVVWNLVINEFGNQYIWSSDPKLVFETRACCSFAVALYFIWV